MRLKMYDTPEFNLCLDLNINYQEEIIELEVTFWDRKEHSTQGWGYPADEFNKALAKYRECEAIIRGR